jgi:hypothetical protein
MISTRNHSFDPFVYIIVLDGYNEITVSLNLLSMITCQRGRGIVREYCGSQSHDVHVANVIECERQVQ